MNQLIELINNLFNIDNNTSAPIIITLIVFILGYLLTGLATSIKYILERRRNRKLFFDLLVEISESAKKQANNFNEFTQKLNVEYEDTFRLKNETITHLDNLTQVSFTTFHNAFFQGIESVIQRKKKIKAFNEIWKHISTLNYWENKYPEDINSFSEKFNEYSNKRNVELEKWRQIFDEILFSTGSQELPPELEEYMDKLGAIVFHWQKNIKNSHYQIVQSELVIPHRELNKNHRNIPFTLHFNTPLLGITYYYENMANILAVYNSLFVSCNNSYRNASETIINNINILK